MPILTSRVSKHNVFAVREIFETSLLAFWEVIQSRSRPGHKARAGV